MFLELDGNGPHYAQLARALQDAIRAGRLPRGARLPPTRELARELALSRTTVLAAYEQLRAEGRIEGRVGSGSYVAALPAAAPPPAPAAEIAAPSRYAHRGRQLQHLLPDAPHELRYNLQYTHPLIHPSLNEIWGRELAHAAAHTALDDIDPQGLLPLRRQICDYLARWRGLRVAPQDILVTHGAQQAFSLIARVLLDEGDTAVVEEPHYVGVYHALATHGADLRSVRTDAEGLVCDELPKPPPRLICVAPAQQFHGDGAMSPARRQALLRYAADTRCWIVEDDIDGELRPGTRPLPPLRAADTTGRVILVGSFSRTLLPSARVGYAVLPTALRQDFVTAKYLDDLACPAIEQAALARFMENGGFERHLRLARKELRQRRATMLEGLRRHAGRHLDIAETYAGRYVLAWLRGHDHASAEALIAQARARGLGLYAVAPHYAGAPPRPGLLLGFARLSGTALREAMQLLGQCLDEARPRYAANSEWCGATRFAVS